MKRILTTLAQKWPEYLLEILVITIGIYGAFMLDNWNDEKKSRANEIELLTNLKSDFVIRLNELQDIKKVRNDMINVIDTLSNIANRAQINRSNDEMDSLLCYMYISYRFNEEFSSLGMLFSSGGIKEITNEELKSKLIEWPWRVQEMIEEQDRIENQLLSLINVMGKYVLANNLIKKFPYAQMSTTLSRDYFTSNYSALLKDRQFIDLMTHKKAYLTFNITDGNNLIDLGNEIVQLIDQEIK